MLLQALFANNQIVVGPINPPAIPGLGENRRVRHPLATLLVPVGQGTHHRNLPPARCLEHNCPAWCLSSVTPTLADRNLSYGVAGLLSTFVARSFGSTPAALIPNASALGAGSGVTFQLPASFHPVFRELPNELA